MKTKAYAVMYDDVVIFEVDKDQFRCEEYDAFETFNEAKDELIRYWDRKLLEARENLGKSKRYKNGT